MGGWCCVGKRWGGRVVLCRKEVGGRVVLCRKEVGWEGGAV